MKRTISFILLIVCFATSNGQCFDPACLKDSIYYNEKGITEVQLFVKPLYLVKALPLEKTIDSLKLKSPYSALVFMYNDTTFYAPIDYFCEKESSDYLIECIEKKAPILIKLRLYEFVNVYYCSESPFSIIVNIK